MRLEEARRDHYRKRAKEEGFRSRAAYKLQQINEKYRLIKNSSKVVDIGCAPGGWLEVVSEIVGTRGLVVGVDIVPVRSVGGSVKILQDDVASEGFPSRLNYFMGKGKADCILADLSPKLSGIWDMDHFKQMELCQTVVDLLPDTLTIDGSLVMKAFHGDELDALTKRVRRSFARIEISKPQASRSESSEIYLVGIGFSGQVPSRSSEAQEVELESAQPSGSGEYDWQSDRLS